ncbi:MULTISPECIES: DeoR/GlpR family DNA-binding transcription regulator [unclassified Mameliella]|uniref:DeoR/GlpR family DNA-binding transcription regulator n=1 Tax=unclassified Mameliella TaxID=2630630 RepID=UPI00273E1599|nr:MULTISPECIES: DeoR/GlpR family DNA-binding transcription regulator [unclassified Mameliella]
MRYFLAFRRRMSAISMLTTHKTTTHIHNACGFPWTFGGRMADTLTKYRRAKGTPDMISKQTHTSMWSHERQSAILSDLLRDGKVQTNALADRFNVSRETIRRDLLDLEKRGSLRRVHGGAVPVAQDARPEAAFRDRLVERPEVKQAIGRRAAELIPAGASLFVDAGTTTRAFALALTQRSDLRVITNCIEIAQILAPVGGIDTLLLGGSPHGEVPATFGELTLSEIDRFLTDYSVVGPVGLSIERGATDYELHEAEVARKMIDRSNTCIMLCDARKIGAESRVSICDIDRIAHVVTDVQTESNFAPAGIEVHRASV